MNKLTTLFITGIFCCLFCNSTAVAQDTVFRFALVTDTHVGSETGREDLERTIADINQQPDVDFVIFSGDITEFGADEELKLAHSVIRQLRKPWYIIPGNHDTKWSESGCNTFRTVFGNETFSFQHKGYWFIGTNSGPNMRMGPGQVPRENIVWLRKELQQQPDIFMPVIYVNHYPQDDGLNNWYEVMDLLRPRNVKAMICGHGHTNRAYNFEGIPGIMCRSNLRARADTGGYNLVSVVRDSLVFSERRPGGTTLPAWNAVSIRTADEPRWEQYPARPSLDINKKFPQVKIKWHLQEDGDMGSAMAIADHKIIYTNTNGDIKAVDAASGKPRWSFHTGGKVYATPLVRGHYVIVPSSDGIVYCVDARNGKKIWARETGKAIVSSPALYRNTAIIAGSDGKCRAWDLRSGKLQWQYDSIRNFVETKPLVYQDKVFFGSWGNRFYALDAATGKEVWQWSNGAANRMFSPAACWPVAVDDKLFIVSPDRYMTTLNTGDGHEYWRVRDTANWVRESIGLSADSNRVYVKTMQGRLLAINSRTPSREIVWASPVEMGYEICPSPIQEYNGVVYAPTGNGMIYALSARDGTLLWQHKFSNCLVNTIQPLDAHTILASSADGKLVCLEIPG